MAIQSLTERFKSDVPVVMDGAMSTELANEGLLFNTDDWLKVNLRQPEILANVHASYARAGARLHIANSFAIAKHVAEYYGFSDEFEDLNRASVTVCREAVTNVSDEPQWIAGSISTYAPDHDRSKLPSLTQLEANCREQALILASAGCDMIALEMVADVETGIAMLRGVAEAALPISIGIVCAGSASGQIQMAHKYRDVVPEALQTGVSRIIDSAPADASLIMTIMHCDVGETTAALSQLQEVWSGQCGAYPHTGRPDFGGGWDMTEACDSQEFSDCCVAAVNSGVCFIGGCCGIGPQYITDLVQWME